MCAFIRKRLKKNNSNTDEIYKKNSEIHNDRLLNKHRLQMKLIYNQFWTKYGNRGGSGCNILTEHPVAEYREHWKYLQDQKAEESRGKPLKRLPDV